MHVKTGYGIEKKRDDVRSNLCDIWYGRKGGTEHVVQVRVISGLLRGNSVSPQLSNGLSNIGKTVRGAETKLCATV